MDWTRSYYGYGLKLIWCPPQPHDEQNLRFLPYFLTHKKTHGRRLVHTNPWRAPVYTQKWSPNRKTHTAEAGTLKTITGSPLSCCLRSVSSMSITRKRLWNLKEKT